MFFPINHNAVKERSSANSVLCKYLASLSNVEKDAWPKHFGAIVKKDIMDECDRKMLFNAVLWANVEVLDLSCVDTLLLKSRDVYFLLIEKLIDAKRAILATKMMNLARKKSVLPNKYFVLKRRLAACRRMYTVNMHSIVNK